MRVARVGGHRHPHEHARADGAGHPQHRPRPGRHHRRGVRDDGDHGAGHDRADHAAAATSSTPSGMFGTEAGRRRPRAAGAQGVFRAHPRRRPRERRAAAAARGDARRDAGDATAIFALHLQPPGRPRRVPRRAGRRRRPRPRTPALRAAAGRREDGSASPSSRSRSSAATSPTTSPSVAQTRHVEPRADRLPPPGLRPRDPRRHRAPRARPASRPTSRSSSTAASTPRRRSSCPTSAASTTGSRWSSPPGWRRHTDATMTVLHVVAPKRDDEAATLGAQGGGREGRSPSRGKASPVQFKVVEDDSPVDAVLAKRETRPRRHRRLRGMGPGIAVLRLAPAANRRREPRVAADRAQVRRRRAHAERRNAEPDLYRTVPPTTCRHCAGTQRLVVDNSSQHTQYELHCRLRFAIVHCARMRGYGDECRQTVPDDRDRPRRHAAVPDGQGDRAGQGGRPPVPRRPGMLVCFATGGTGRRADGARGRRALRLGRVRRRRDGRSTRSRKSCCTGR